MNRNEFLKLTGWTEQRLKNSILRDHLPFFSRAPGKKWRRHDYTERQAVLMVVADELTRGDGLRWEMVAKMLRGPSAAVRSRESWIFGGKFILSRPGALPGETRAQWAGPNALEPTDHPGQDVWIGIAEQPRLKEPRFVLGTLAAVVEDVNEGLANLEDGPIFSRLFLANLTDAIRRVRARADDYGIDLADGQPRG